MAIMPIDCELTDFFGIGGCSVLVQHGDAMPGVAAPQTASATLPLVVTVTNDSRHFSGPEKLIGAHAKMMLAPVRMRFV